jgi:hypothetical protein
MQKLVERKTFRNSELPNIFDVPFRPAIRAELFRSDTCTAGDLTARGHAPVLVLCRELIAAGCDPDRALEVYRGSTLALRVRSIGAGAAMTVAERPNGPIFEAWKPFPTPAIAAPMRQSQRGAA